MSQFSINPAAVTFGTINTSYVAISGALIILIYNHFYNILIFIFVAIHF